MNTKHLEDLMFKELSSRNKLLVFEVGIPKRQRFKIINSLERVDACIYDIERNEVNMYELKVSVGDFNSKAKLSFCGDRNYYVLAENIYKHVSHKIPKDIGVYLGNDKGEFWLEKPAKRKKATVDKKLMLKNVTKALNREYREYREYLYKQRKKSNWL